MFDALAIFLVIIATIVSYFATRFFISYAHKHALIDIPNQRSSHTIPTPRGGGVVFSAVWTIFALLLWLTNLTSIHSILVLLPPAITLGILGFLDDRGDIKARWRLIIQFLAALYFVFMLGGFHHLNLGFYTVPLSILGSVIAIIGIIWSINLYNFMDGTDGIAAAEALFILIIGGALFWYAGGHNLAWLIWGLSGTIVGFLILNFPPAKVFMGDCGSNFLGFLLIAFALIGAKFYNIPLLIWLILYGTFWFDATVTLIRRLLRKEKVYEAHRLHTYQRLQLCNFSHKKILFIESIVNLLLVILALLGFFFSNYLLLFFLISCIILFSGYLWVEKAQPMYPKDV